LVSIANFVFNDYDSGYFAKVVFQECVILAMRHAFKLSSVVIYFLDCYLQYQLFLGKLNSIYYGKFFNDLIILLNFRGYSILLYL
jgi:hypothetical protein